MRRGLALFALLWLAGCYDFDADYQACIDEGRCLPEGGQVRALDEACGPLDRCADGLCVDGTCRKEVCSAGVHTAPADCSTGVCVGTATRACAGGLCGASDCATVKQVVAGYGFTCALLSDGSVWCWGDNSLGQLGLGDTEPRLAPTRIPTLAGVKQLAANESASFACALLENGTTGVTDDSVACWGSNYYGQLGLGVADTSRSTPQRLQSLTNVASVAVGGFHACAIVRGTGGSYRAWCWGENTYGQVGDGTSGNVTGASARTRPSPVPVCSAPYSGSGCLGPSNQFELALGLYHSCSRAGTAVTCWGDNSMGQLGVSKDFSPHPNPLVVPGLTTPTAPGAPVVFAGESTTCAIDNTGAAKCWGYNGAGQLANGTFGGDSSTPMPLCKSTGGSPCTPLTSVTSIAIGEASACALLVDAVAVCWGRDSHLQLGNGLPAGDTNYANAQVKVTGPVVGLTLGSYHGCTWSETEVRCWGWNAMGQVGTGQAGTDDPSIDDQANPVGPRWP